MNNTLMQLLDLAPDCKQISADHGFWDEGETRSKGEMIALINSELYESLEGHRKGKRFITNDKAIDPDNYTGESWIECFKDNVKDTVEDEIADAVIRILDYTWGWNIPVIERDYRKESLGNYGHDLLRLNWYVLLAFEQKEDIHPGKDWGYALAAIIEFCKWYKIDIVTHVQWKMRFNRTRPHKHGKAY